MTTKKVVITGGPGTGKSSIINELKQRGHCCMDEISRQITLQAQHDGVSQLFLTNPLLFSELLLKGRVAQFNDANTLSADMVFFDRGIPDILAYMHYIGNKYPENFTTASKHCSYDTVFILQPWKAIYQNDNERYESFEEAKDIYKHLLETYTHFNYKPIHVPFGTVKQRCDFILHTLY